MFCLITHISPFLIAYLLFGNILLLFMCMKVSVSDAVANAAVVVYSIDRCFVTKKKKQNEYALYVCAN